MSGATDLGIIAVNTNLEAGDPPTVVVAYADNVEFEGAVFPKKGLYVCVQLYWFTSSITIPGYRFEVGKTVKQLDPKFIPASVKLPAVTTEDAGKFLRVSADGAWAAETATSEEWTFTLEDDSTVTKKVVVIE